METSTVVFLQTNATILSADKLSVKERTEDPSVIQSLTSPLAPFASGADRTCVHTAVHTHLRTNTTHHMKISTPSIDQNNLLLYNLTKIFIV